MISHFSKTTNCTHPVGSCNFVIFEKITCAYHHQKTLKITLLPILTCLVSV